MPAVRKIVHDSERSNYKLSAVVLGIVQSLPFQMRRADMPKAAHLGEPS